jgi:alkanesulfonate monooxygenase SsuD/methylene tetrahydromethanopterin reductase-like flavin-dependent oxidoreductase (luciferase family)
MLFRTPGLPALDAPDAVRGAVEAEALGFDSLWVADHLMLGQDEAILEGWTTLAAIAGATRRAKLGLIHQAHYFRHPAVAAKMMATLDALSGGRFIFFADTGTRPAEHWAYGLRYPPLMTDRMPEFLEGLELIRKLWQAGAAAPLTFVGQFYQVTGAVCAPQPVTRPHPPLWLGEAHPLTLEACARLGQGWNSAPVGLAELERRLGELRAACARAGRPFDELEISYETQVLIAPSREAVREQLRAMLALTPAGAEKPQDADFLDFVNGASDVYPRYLSEAWLVGTPAEVRAQVEDYARLGVRHFLLWFMDAPGTEGMRLFMDEVAAVAADVVTDPDKDVRGRCVADIADGAGDPGAV